MIKPNITYVDLFAGLGAFAKGILDAGFKFKHHYFSEVDKFAIANYLFNFKNAKNLGDVQKIKTENIQKPDILTFGSPCQDISHAGQKKGIFGNRSKLFFNAVGIIDRLRPKVFVFENVKALLFGNKGKDFEVVLREIANLGVYECQWQLINTAWLLPQNRERLFLVGSLREVGLPRIFPLLTGYSENETRLKRIDVLKRYSNYNQDIIYSTQNCAPTLMVGKGSPTSIIKMGKQYRKLTPIECERLQGLPDDWTKYGRFENEIKEISKTQRYSMLGNAITSLVMKLIAQKILPVFGASLQGISLTELEQEALDLITQLNQNNK